MHLIAALASYSCKDPSQTSYGQSGVTKLSAPRTNIIRDGEAGITQVASNCETLPGTGRIPAGQIYGVTTDDGYNTTTLPDSIRSLSKPMATRIVYDEFVPATDYIAGTTAIYNVSYVMGLLLDSNYFTQYTVAAYANRAIEYYNALKSKVDIWEVGNEVNGEWVGPPADVAAKIAVAYDYIKGQGGVTALTLNYNRGCSASINNDMFYWIENYLPSRMKTGLDYVWVSYYEDDCLGYLPDWNEVFGQLAPMFPNSRVGIGEFGTTNPAKKADMIRRYYNLSIPGVINQGRFVGGYFYWYYMQDMVPKSKPLWSYLNGVLGSLP